MEDSLAVAEESDSRVPRKAEARGNVVGVVLRLDDGIDRRERIAQIKRRERQRVLRSGEIVISNAALMVRSDVSLMSS